MLFFYPISAAILIYIFKDIIYNNCDISTSKFAVECNLVALETQVETLDISAYIIYCYNSKIKQGS